MRQHILLNHVGVAGSFEAALQGFYEGPEVDNANSEEAEELDHLDADGIREHMKRVVRVRTPRNVDDLANRRGDDSFPPVSAQRTYEHDGKTNSIRAQ